MSIGSILMGVWFLLFGLFHFVPVSQGALVLAVLALVVGILILVGR